MPSYLFSVDIDSDSADLTENDRFMLTFQGFHQIENLNRKVNRKCTQSAFSHNVISFPVNIALKKEKYKAACCRVSEG